jgi:hypothetical protein
MTNMAAPPAGRSLEGVEDQVEADLMATNGFPTEKIKNNAYGRSQTTSRRSPDHS